MFTFNDMNQAVCEVLQPLALNSQTHYDYEPNDSQIGCESAQNYSMPVTNSYDYEVKSPTEQMSQFLDDYSNKIESMFLTTENTDRIFNLSVRLVEEFTQLCRNLSEAHRYGDDFILQPALDFVRNKLSEHCSSYKRCQKLTKNEFYVPPCGMVMGTHWEMVKSKCNNITIPRLLPSNFHYISIVQTVQSLFKQKKFKEMYFEYNSGEFRHRCVEGEYKFFCCGSLFKESPLYSSQPQALQLQFATDDFETNDALGSKAGIHKMCPIYFTIKNVPSKYLSKVSNIYLVSLCRSDDIKTKETDFNDLWEHIVRELLYLEETGIQIDINTNIKGTMIYGGFDNLGGNTAYGFVESFNSHFCRFCISSKKLTETMVKEDTSLLRTIENYESHLKIVENSEKVIFSETKGVKRKCALNKLNNFHILKNKSVDIMHDLNEGCIPFLLKHLFQHLISKKVLSEDELQKKIQFFDFGRYSKNPLSIVMLKKDNLNQNAATLMKLFRHIGFIFRDLQQNETIKNVWICVESLQKVVQVCYSPEISDAQVKQLEQDISTHLQSILDVLGLHLIPKHHLLTHYPKVICEMGPVCHMNMIRHEAKHKDLKNFAKRGNNYINITKTISVRHQSELVYNGFTYCDELDCGKISFIPFSQLNEIEKEVMNKFIIEGEILCGIEWFKCNYLTFRSGMAVLHGKQFHKINRILVLNDKYFFSCDGLEFELFESFTHSLILKKSMPLSQKLIQFDELSTKKPYDIKLIEEKLFIFAETLDVCQAM